MSNVALLLLLVGATTPASAGNCEIVDATESPSPSDEVRARTGCEAARASFAELFGEPAPGAHVVLWEEPGYRIGLRRGEAVIFWPTSEAMTPRPSKGQSVDLAAVERHIDEQWREVLPHEIAHLLLAARFFPDQPAAPAGGYGTPLPDWVDEAVAIWAEPVESRQRRLEQARGLPAARRDLLSILTTPHPATGSAAAYTARDGTARQADDTLWAFYPQAISVLAFIYDQGGSAAVREVVERLVVDPDDQLALTGIPGLPVDFDELLMLWEEWMAADTESAVRSGG